MHMMHSFLYSTFVKLEASFSKSSHTIDWTSLFVNISCHLCFPPLRSFSRVLAYNISVVPMSVLLLWCQLSCHALFNFFSILSSAVLFRGFSDRKVCASLVILLLQCMEKLMICFLGGFWMWWSPSRCLSRCSTTVQYTWIFNKP